MKMKKVLFFAVFCLLGILATHAQDFTQYVDPRIGTVGLGRTFPL